MPDNAPTQKRSTPPRSKALARRINAILAREGFDCTTLRIRLDAFRADNRDAIVRAAGALKDCRALRLVDSTRYRAGAEEAHVAEKVAEAVARTVQHRSYAGELQRAREKAAREREARRDAYHSAARALRRVEAEAANALRFRRRSDFYAKLAESWNGSRPRTVPGLRLAGYRDLTPSHHLNVLNLDLLAILTHTTDLRTNYVLDKIAPKVFGAALHLDGSGASRRGEPNALKRYKESRERIVSSMRALGDDVFTMEDDLLLRRCLLFAEDDRFPLLLFAPHRRIRTVPNRAPRARVS